ncbi:elongation factor P maturation arginine rhamnosyltransferase EarP [Chromatiaceae bacterium AAb-1]|nr:elongation factor P maturation arginine rhamnosyltransferase EarP [Chromatiaceae bacterium AAb-1]
MPVSAKGALWDIFCAVVDNFGDIGICWRFSRQLATEHKIPVRLWVDDLHSFQKICPQVDPALPAQHIEGVNVVLWSADTQWQQTTIATVVIEALACTIPEGYQQRMAATTEPVIWLNLEYLSAESWIEDCHGLTSPQAHPLLHKYFFFPGFTARTGGLLQEQHLQQKLAAFRQDKTAQLQFWHQLAIEQPAYYQRKISLFAYSHPQLAELLVQWQQEHSATLCLIPEGALAEQVKQLYPELQQQRQLTAGNLTLRILPFMPQPQYDLLLAACDFNFVRGEDSVIRAHWAGQPFIWQIYRQQEQAHLIKLNAFLARYTTAMPAALQQTITAMFLSWNTESALVADWVAFSSASTEIIQFNRYWQQQLSELGDLSGNLVRFVEKKFIMHRNFS